MANYNKRPALERFMEKVTPVTESGCWLWTASTDLRGYGAFYFNGRLQKAHRVSLTLHGRPAAANEYVCHKCDTPSCVNPDHLFAGTPQENHDDMRAKGRARYSRCQAGAKNTNAKLTKDAVLSILACNETTTELARKFGVTYQAVWQIRNGLKWKEVA